MGIMAKLRLLGATALSFSLIHLGSAQLPLTSSWHTSDRAIATTGGRARGGSFDQPAPAEPMPGGGGAYGGGGYAQPDFPPYQSDPYGYDNYDNGDPFGYPNRRSRSYNPRGRYYPQPPVVIPIPNTGSYGSPYDSPYNSSPGYSTTVIGVPPILPLAAMALFLFVPFFVVASRFGTLNNRATNRANNRSPYGTPLNDAVTVTRLQIALLAGARPLQAVLDQIATHSNLQTKQGLSAMLQETVLALLRSPEHWSHVQVNSQTVNTRQEASRLFEQLSIEERSKFNSETLVNVGGQLRRQTAQFSTEDNPNSGYIVVTLLLGTESDRPLATIYSTTELQVALQQLGAIHANELLVFELLWTPQDPGDVLSRDELLSEYPSMTQL